MAKCCWCKKSGLLLTVNRYGFCKSCSDEVRGRIKEMLNEVRSAAKSAGEAPDRPALLQMTPQLTKALETIRQLEELRPRVPFFKSDTAEYAKTILLGLQRAAGKAPFAPDPPDGTDSAVEKAVAQVLSAPTAVGRRVKGGGPDSGGHLDFPLTADGLVPAYLYGSIALASPCDPAKTGLLWGRVLLEQDPQDGDDPDMVRVYQAGQELGCLSEGPVRKMVNAWLDRELPVLARLSRTGKKDRPPELEICFYDQEKKSGFRFFPLVLPRQLPEDLTAAHWPPVRFRWQPQQERYAVYDRDGRELGFLPPQAEALLENEEPFAFLYQVQNAGDGPPLATVAIERQRRRWVR